MIALLIAIDYYCERLKSFVTISTVVSLSHSVMILCSFLKIDEILKRFVCTVKNQLLPTKYDPLCQKMAAIWSSSMPMYIRIELDSNVGQIARNEMQDAVDGAGLNGHVKIY